MGEKNATSLKIHYFHILSHPPLHKFHACSKTGLTKSSSAISLHLDEWSTFNIFHYLRTYGEPLFIRPNNENISKVYYSSKAKTNVHDFVLPIGAVRVEGPNTRFINLVSGIVTMTVRMGSTK